MKKETVFREAQKWADRTGLNAWVYKTPRGWKWAADFTIARMASATIEKI